MNWICMRCTDIWTEIFIYYLSYMIFHIFHIYHKSLPPPPPPPFFFSSYYLNCLNYLLIPIPTPLLILFLVLPISISIPRISIDIVAISNIQSSSPDLKFPCARRSAVGTRIPNQCRGSRGSRGGGGAGGEVEGGAGAGAGDGGGGGAGGASAEGGAGGAAGSRANVCPISRGEMELGVFGQLFRGVKVGGALDRCSMRRRRDVGMSAVFNGRRSIDCVKQSIKERDEI